MHVIESLLATWLSILTFGLWKHWRNDQQEIKRLDELIELTEVVKKKLDALDSP